LASLTLNLLALFFSKGHANGRIAEDSKLKTNNFKILNKKTGEEKWPIFFSAKNRAVILLHYK